MHGGATYLASVGVEGTKDPQDFNDLPDDVTTR